MTFYVGQKVYSSIRDTIGTILEVVKQHGGHPSWYHIQFTGESKEEAMVVLSPESSLYNV